MIKKRIDTIVPGMAVGRTVYGDNYEIFLKKGVKLTQPYIDLLKKGGF